MSLKKSANDKKHAKLPSRQLKPAKYFEVGEHSSNIEIMA